MILYENVQRRIIAVVIQLSQADKEGINNVARSAYYRSAIILLCTIVESLVYALVESEVAKAGGVYDKRIELKRLHKLPRSIFNRGDTVIARENEKELLLQDYEPKFDEMNRFLKRNGIVDETEFRKLEYVRKERNKMHLQSLKTPDTGYTKDKVKRVSVAVDFLMEIISSRGL